MTIEHTAYFVVTDNMNIEAKTVSLYMGHSDVLTTLRIYTHPEQLNRAVFLNGKMTENEKLEHLKREYAEVLEIIDDFLK